MSTEIQKRFEDAAKYDGMMAKIFPGYEQIPLVILSHLRTRLGQTANLLDAGCGTGATLTTFAIQQPEWSFIGVDPAEPMLEIARNKIRAIGMEKRVTFINGTVDALSEEPKFDGATCILVEHLQPDNGAKLRLLDGIHRRMVSGGWFILFGLHGNLVTQKAQNALKAWLEFVMLQGLPETARDNVRHRATVEDSLVPEERILELLGEAGFVNIERIYQLHLLGGWLAQKA
jgi:tRNA (cmo5U34)-methyltransferase